MAEIDLFAVQAYVDERTYVSEEAFRAAMARLVAECVDRRARRQDGSFAIPALAVFPENVATFLALASLGRVAPRLLRSEIATLGALLLHPRRFLRAVSRSGVRRPTVAALLALAPEVREVYERTFSELARASQMSLVAGSALLPDGGDEVHNLSLTFAPDGSVAARVRKVNLVPDMEDTLGLRGGVPEALPVPALPVGPVGTLICYDGFRVPHTRAEPGFRAVGGVVAEAGARIVANPAANPWTWDGPWVHRRAGSSLLRREQWRCEGLESQLPDMTGVEYGVTAHLVGRVLEQRFEGRSAIYRRHAEGRVEVLAEASRYALDPRSEEIVHARVEAPWLD